MGAYLELRALHASGTHAHCQVGVCVGGWGGWVSVCVCVCRCVWVCVGVGVCV